MEVDETNTVYVYMWISHGASVSGYNEHFKVESKFKNIALFSKPLQLINAEILFKLEDDPCSLFSNMNIKKQEKVNNITLVSLPPLVFMNYEHESAEVVRNFTGLYRYEFSFVGDSCGRMITRQKILGHNDFIVMFGSNSNITYSQIFKLVKKDCNRIRVDPGTITLGIYACGGIHSDYERYYPFPNPTETEAREPPQANIVDTLNTDDLVATPIRSGLPVNYLLNWQSKSWTPLAKLTTQGCALNVLSYYDMLGETNARVKTVCLTKGTSIYKIIDYIANYYGKNTITKQIKYMIIRYPIQKGLHLIYYMIRLRTSKNKVMIFKMYKDKMHKDKLSQVGHTVSVANIQDDIYFIDPQGTKFSSRINNAEMLIHYISSNYAPQQWNYIDIIYAVINADLAHSLLEPSILRIVATKTNLTQYVQDNDGEILPADRTSIMYGGYEHKRQIKRKNKTKSKTKSKKYNTKKRSNKHYKKHYKTRYRK